MGEGRGPGTGTEGEREREMRTCLRRRARGWPMPASGQSGATHTSTKGGGGWGSASGDDGVRGERDSRLTTGSSEDGSLESHGLVRGSKVGGRGGGRERRRGNRPGARRPRSSAPRAHSVSHRTTLSKVALWVAAYLLLPLTCTPAGYNLPPERDRGRRTGCS